MLDRLISSGSALDKFVAVAGNGGMLGFLLTNPSFLTALGTVVVAVSTGAYYLVRTVREWRKMEHDEELREEWKARRWVMCTECDEFNPPDARKCENCGYVFEQGDEDDDDPRA